MSKRGKLVLAVIVVGLLAVGVFAALPAAAKAVGAKGTAYAALTAQAGPVKATGLPDVGFRRGWGHKFGLGFGPIEDLQSVPPEQRFGHFLGSQFSYTDANGQKHTIYATPGTVSSVTSNSITITVNGTNESKAFNVTSSTVIGARPPRGSLQAINQGDQVVVVTKDNSSDALAIMKVSPRVPKRTSPTPTPTS